MNKIPSTRLARTKAKIEQRGSAVKSARCCTACPPQGVLSRLSATGGAVPRVHHRGCSTSCPPQGALFLQ